MGEGECLPRRAGGWSRPCRWGRDPQHRGPEGWGRVVGWADEGRTLRERAGPRPLTVATRYCRVPQSRTARLNRSSRYCKEEPRLMVTWTDPAQGLQTSGFLHPPPLLLPSHRAPCSDSNGLLSYCVTLLLRPPCPVCLGGPIHVLQEAAPVPRVCENSSSP